MVFSAALPHFSGHPNMILAGVAAAVEWADLWPYLWVLAVASACGKRGCICRKIRPDWGLIALKLYYSNDLR